MTTTYPGVFYPDVSVFQNGVPLSGALAACARATEGDWLTDSRYAGYKASAAANGTFFTAYHFLEAGSSPAAQAAYCFKVVGAGVPLMLDVEPISGGVFPRGRASGARPQSRLHWRLARLRAEVFGGYISEPSIAQAAAFVDAYRKLGGICNAVYLPRWYWLVLGSPSLAPFAIRNMILVSSQYAAYGTGVGWAPYGGMTPSIWQYSDSISFNGVVCDFNAWRGDLAGLKNVWLHGTYVPPDPFPQPQYTEDPMVVLDSLTHTGPAVVLPIPAGKKALLLYADDGYRTAVKPQLRIGFHGGAWNGQTVSPAWHAPVKVAIPSGSVEVTIARLDPGAVPVTADFA